MARQGGDEFLILIGDFDGHRAEPEWMRTACDQIARKVQTALHAPFLVAGTELHTSASIGISVFPVDATDAEGMLKNGDIAMYKVKESGRDGYQLYASDGHDRVAQLSMAGRLRGAVGRDEMVLHYQPLIELATGCVVGVEALVRWNDPARGMVPPIEFIPLAERTGVIGPLSDWVIEEACRQGAEWRAQGLDLYVSVNMPPALWQPTAMRHVLKTIEQFGLHAGRVMIEITESAAMADEGRVEPILTELHERGLRLAIDDFGTGHSSLSRLSQMMVTTLKIDRSFVHDLPGDSQRHRARLGDHPARAQARPAAARGGHRDRGAARLPDGRGLHVRPGLPLLTGRAGGRGRPARAQPRAPRGLIGYQVWHLSV